jgi:hypothetical protein
MDNRLAREDHLDPRVVNDGITKDLADVIIVATKRAVPFRYDDAGEWIELLLEEITRPEPVPAVPEIDPLEARKDDELAFGLKVEAVLGYGATSRALQVLRASDCRVCSRRSGSEEALAPCP